MKIIQIVSFLKIINQQTNYFIYKSLYKEKKVITLTKSQIFPLNLFFFLRNCCSNFFSINCFSLEIITNYLPTGENIGISKEDQESKKGRNDTWKVVCNENEEKWISPNVPSASGEDWFENPSGCRSLPISERKSMN